MGSHYNTTAESGQVLIDFNSKASAQESKVLDLFTWYCRPLAWFEVLALLPEPMNEVSLKRALTNLKNEGKLIKTNIKAIGHTGRPSYKYQLV